MVVSNVWLCSDSRGHPPRTAYTRPKSLSVCISTSMICQPLLPPPDLPAAASQLWGPGSVLASYWSPPALPASYWPLTSDHTLTNTTSSPPPQPSAPLALWSHAICLDKPGLLENDCWQVLHTNTTLCNSLVRMSATA